MVEADVVPVSQGKALSLLEGRRSCHLQWQLPCVSELSEFRRSLRQAISLEPSTARGSRARKFVMASRPQPAPAGLVDGSQRSRAVLACENRMQGGGPLHGRMKWRPAT